MLKSASLQTRVYDGITGTWDETLPQFPNASFDQTEFLGASLWGGHRLSKLLVSKGERLVGAAQIAQFRLPSPTWGPGIAYLKAGPVWRGDDAADERETLDYTLRAVVNEYAVRRGLCLMVTPPVDPVRQDETVERLVQLGFERRRTASSPDRYMVDLTLSEADQRQSLSQKWRAHLRRAEAGPLVVRQVSGEAGVATFMRLHEQMRERKQYRDESWAASLPDLYAEIPETIRPWVHLAFEGETPVAGIVVGAVGETALYLFGATSERGLATRAGYLLHWQAITELSQRTGIKWYDLDSDAGEPGLRQFKSGLIGKRGVRAEVAGEYEYCESSASALTSRMIQTARSLKARLQR